MRASRARVDAQWCTPDVQCCTHGNSTKRLAALQLHDRVRGVHWRVGVRAALLLVIVGVIWWLWRDDAQDGSFVLSTRTTSPSKPPGQALTRVLEEPTSPARTDGSAAATDAGTDEDACGEGRSGERLLASVDAAHMRHWLEAGRDGGTLQALMGEVDRERVHAWVTCKRDAGEEMFFETLGRRIAQLRLEFNAAEAERTVDRFCTESARVTKNAALGQPPRTRDAAVFMTGRVDWEKGHLPVPVGMLQLSGALDAHLNAAGGWRTVQPSELVGLDFGWMRELLAYDFWSMEGGGPLKDLDESATNYTSWQVPNYWTLMKWSRLRLVKGIQEADLPQAALEVRHLAELCASNNMIGLMVRSSLYRSEREAWAMTSQTPPVPPPGDKELAAFRALAFASQQYLLPGVSGATRARALECMPIRCLAVQDAIGLTASVRESVPQAGDHLEWLLQQKQCEPALAARLAKTAEFSAEQLVDLAKMETLESYLAQVSPPAIQ